jgi:hypothetical protein
MPAEPFPPINSSDNNVQHDTTYVQQPNSGNINFVKAVKGVVKFDVTKSLNKPAILTPNSRFWTCHSKSSSGHV